MTYKTFVVKNLGIYFTVFCRKYLLTQIFSWKFWGSFICTHIVLWKFQQNRFMQYPLAWRRSGRLPLERLPRPLLPGRSSRGFRVRSPDTSVHVCALSRNSPCVARLADGVIVSVLVHCSSQLTLCLGWLFILCRSVAFSATSED